MSHGSQKNSLSRSRETIMVTFAASRPVGLSFSCDKNVHMQVLMVFKSLIILYRMVRCIL